MRSFWFRLHVAYSLRKAIGVPRTRIERLAREETAITADTALRLGRYFKMTPQFWMNLQSQYELERRGAGLRTLAQRSSRIAEAELDAAE